VAGILGYGVYLPALRLARASILAAHGWLNPGLKGLARGELAVCDWDEDALTMAVEAARAASRSVHLQDVTRLVLASTTQPFENRLGAALLTEALRVSPEAVSIDVGGSMRAGLTAVRAALHDAQAAESGVTLCIASDRRQARPASPQEMLFGAGAAALAIGRGRVVARMLGAHSHTADFVDQFRVRGNRYGVHWEERWVRDEGYLRLLPNTAQALLSKLGVAAADIDHVVIPVALPGVAERIAAAIGIPADRVADNQYDACGDIGAAYPLLLLIAALERANPGERILVCAFGQGCDAVLLEATEELPAIRDRSTGVRAALSRRLPETNYLRHLCGAGQLDVDTGMRAEAPSETPLSAGWRERETVLGFIGGRCRRCGTVQFPRSIRCVNPHCHAGGPQHAVELANRSARVLTWTADHLAFSLRPPVRYGTVEFDGGGRALLEFVDVREQALHAGARIQMVFRLRRIEPRRGYRSYFWKATPLLTATGRAA
jgi:3-hydroxy-3-methylglutaryl CoA synthase